MEFIDAAFSGILGPVRDGGLSLNAAAHAAGQTLPKIFTTPFWVYFVAIGGCGSCLALAILLVRSKSKQLNTVGKVGIILHSLEFLNHLFLESH